MSFAVSWRGMVRRVPHSLAAKDIEKKVNLTELSQDAKKNFFDLIFNIPMLIAKCMPIDFEFQQGLFCILTNCQTYLRYFKMLTGSFGLNNLFYPF